MKVIYQPKGRAAEYSLWAANLYRGCSHGCKYCYAPNVLMMSKEEFAKPSARRNVIQELTQDAASLDTVIKVLLCFSCDPYQPINDVLHLTGQAISILHYYGHKVSILTKGGARAISDFSLLGEGDDFGTTLTTLDSGKSLEWEPEAVSPYNRIETIKKAHDRGIQTWVSLEPVLWPEDPLAIIGETAPFVDHYKLGILNHCLPPQPIDWRDYGDKAIALLQKLGKDFYIKQDLHRRLNL